MFAAENLDVQIFVVVLVQGCGAVGVSEPEVDGVGVLGEGDTGKGDGLRDICE